MILLYSDLNSNKIIIRILLAFLKFSIFINFNLFLYNSKNTYNSYILIILISVYPRHEGKQSLKNKKITLFINTISYQ